MEELRAEILEAERVRSDLLKWKLVLVAGLGAVGLGLNPDTKTVPLVLIGVPLVCAYVDLLCRHLILRVHVIAQFIRDPGDEPSDAAAAAKQRLLQEYERFVQTKRSVFGFENWALFGSSTVLSVVVGAWGIYLHGDTKRWWAEALIASAVAGLVLTVAIEWMFESRKEKVTPDEERIPRWWRWIRRESRQPAVPTEAPRPGA